MKIYLDTETCGFHGMPVLIQYATDTDPVRLYEIWRNPVKDTLDLIEWMCQHTVVGFNLAFDWFHLAKVYTMFRLLDPTWIPDQHIDEVAAVELAAQDGPCIKPTSAMDLMLHSRKGKYQSLMSRNDIHIRRVPNALANDLAEILEEKVAMDGIYFAARADATAPRWGVFDRKKRDGTPDLDFKDVVLKFKPKGGLKFLVEYVLKIKPPTHFSDVELSKCHRPVEFGYAPTALAVNPGPDWEVYKGRDIVGYAWPGVIRRHIQHWATEEAARVYAENDVVYTRLLDEHFEFPEPGDDDSVLACMVAAIRWHGFTLNNDGLRTLQHETKQIVDASPVNINSPVAVRAYMTEVMDEIEQLVIAATTEKAKLEEISEWVYDEDEGDSVHPAAQRARQILAVKSASKEVELYEKLLRAEKFHASFNIIGALSSRMSGADGLNAQGIKNATRIREMFSLKWDDYVLCGGDFAAFEVTIADAVCNDESLRQELLGGKKIHALFAEQLFPGVTYEEILASDGTENDMYSKGKRGFFGVMLYGGDYHTLVKRLAIKQDVAEAAIQNFGKRFTGIQKWRRNVADRFCSMTQPGGIGTAVIWKDPSDYCESFLGFRRYFTLENQICKALFDLARKPPKHWRNCKIKVMRSNRVQSAGGAAASALYGAAFQIQAGNTRAAANHEIQSVGATITKALQRNIWDIQPAGVGEWRVAPMNVHDEIMCVTHPDSVEQVTAEVKKTVAHYRQFVPLLGIDWCENAQNWSEKKAGQIKIRG